MDRRATPYQDGNLDPIIINGKRNIFTTRRNGDRGAAARPDRFDQELSGQVGSLDFASRAKSRMAVGADSYWPVARAQ
jgi:hypothetical protein